MKALALALAVVAAAPLHARGLAGLADAQIVLLGEVHDNPGHHIAQAEAVEEIAPRAIVFEMLTAEQAAKITPRLKGDAIRLAADLEWDASGWPDFSMYFPIFSAASEARIFGAALPRDAARAALQGGIPAHFGPSAEEYGLTTPLPAEEQSAREAEQAEVHCDALPADLLPGMVQLQRLRDAMLARAAIQALDTFGAPVVVITGNGHARRDGGVPASIARVRPQIKVVSVGQDEGGRIEGTYDIVWPGPLVKRRDPCEAMRSK